METEQSAEEVENAKNEDEFEYGQKVTIRYDDRLEFGVYYGHNPYKSHYIVVTKKHVRIVPKEIVEACDDGPDIELPEFEEFKKNMIDFRNNFNKFCKENQISKKSSKILMPHAYMGKMMSCIIKHLGEKYD